LEERKNLEMDYLEAISWVTEQVLKRIEYGSLTPIILIDGRAASGKSTFATELQSLLFKQGESLPRLIHMDDLYEGWNGLALGSDYLQRFILAPLASREIAYFQEWSWEEGKRIDWREFAGGTPLIIEGCGSISSRSAGHGFMRIWLQADEATRRSRWLAREGTDEMFDLWAAQELNFYSSENSQQHIDIVVNTADSIQ
jgi:hypothetical protein